MKPPRSITSRDNPLLQQVRKLERDPGAYRKLGSVWLEGEHLCSALLARGGRPAQALVAQSAIERPDISALLNAADDVALLPDRLFAELSALPSPAGMGFVCTLPDAPAVDTACATVLLDRVQDAGNVGSILRSAAALGVRQVLAIKGTAGLWSPKVLRAGMGAHFGLALVEGLDQAALLELGLPLVATSSHAGETLPHARLPSPCAWIFGHEGQGVSDAFLEHCAMTVRIPQPGGEESLNVAAAAAICLYESQRRLA